MSETNTKSKNPKAAPGAKSTKPKPAAAPKTTAEAPAQAPVAKATERKKLPHVDDKEYVDVVSGYAGGLVYVSYNTRNKIEWARCGDVNPMTVEELREMRNTQRAFFENHWVYLVGENADAVISYLQLDKYGVGSQQHEKMENIFHATPEEVEAMKGSFTQAELENIAHRAFGLMQDGAIDSNRMIDALELLTGYDLRGELE